MPGIADVDIDSRRGQAVQPLRSRRVAPAGPSGKRRVLNWILGFAAVVLIVDALVGDKGLIETLHARRQYREVAASLETLRRDNAALRESIRRLKEDPATIEGIARQDLGLIRPGEVLFIVKDVKPAR